MYELRYSETALRQLRKLEKSLQQRILTALERLRIRPESCDIKKLVGMQGYRFRVCDYRIIFDIEKTELHIIILPIGQRRTTYK